jgi:nitrite reductase/ring-hydroxylating ferredoxin subunit
MPDDALRQGRLTKATVAGTDILLYRDQDRIYAVNTRCSHRGGPLHKGWVEALDVTCPWHLSTFDLRDGSIVRGPASAPQPAYEVRVADGIIEVRSPRD